MAIKSVAIFEKIKTLIGGQTDQDPSKRKVHAAFAFQVTQSGKIVYEFTLDTKDLKVYEGNSASGEPDVKIVLDDDDFANLADGKLNPETAIQEGMIKTSGNPEAVAILPYLLSQIYANK